MGYKPAGITSQSFANRLKYKYNVKKAGFSGTLDPFAKGVMVIGFGQYPKLFQYLKKTPKSYRAVLWLGAFSEGLDTENIEEVHHLDKYDELEVKKAVEGLSEITSQVPPKFCAKRVNGVRAYHLARSGEEVNLAARDVVISKSTFIHYHHPYVTFEVSVSEGTYVRTLGASVAASLDTFGSLCSLERLCEGEFTYEDELELNPLPYLDMPQNELMVEDWYIEKGIKIRAEFFKNHEDGFSYIEMKDTFSIIEFKEGAPKYKINMLPKGKR